MTRESRHVEPRGALQTARHYVRELIYGANDGVITRFAVVAGVSGGGLPLRVVLIIGAANLFADGLSMAMGNYLSIKAHESVLETQDLPEEEASPSRHGLATFLAFVVAGAVPLAPYMVPIVRIDRFTTSIAFTLLALFAVGASRALIADVRWWRAGLKMLVPGAVVAGVAYGSGALVSAMLQPERMSFRPRLYQEGSSQTRWGIFPNDRGKIRTRVPQSYKMGRASPNILLAWMMRL
jgi:VIT1/CCC1 family predicted Fe2+/Mn2+ transporter